MLGISPPLFSHPNNSKQHYHSRAVISFYSHNPPTLCRNERVLKQGVSGQCQGPAGHYCRKIAVMWVCVCVCFVLILVCIAAAVLFLLGNTNSAWLPPHGPPASVGNMFGSWLLWRRAYVWPVSWPEGEHANIVNSQLSISSEHVMQHWTVFFFLLLLFSLSPSPAHFSPGPFPQCVSL